MRLHDDVRRARVGRRIVEFELQLVAGEHFVDEESLRILVDEGRRGGRLALVGEPDQRDVVVLNEAAGTGGAVVGDPDRRRARVASRAIAATRSAKWPGLLTFAGLIGDWPCLALTMISVDS